MRGPSTARLAALAQDDTLGDALSRDDCIPAAAAASGIEPMPATSTLRAEDYPAAHTIDEML
jgi:hypothetical protein